MRRFVSPFAATALIAIGWGHASARANECWYLPKSEKSRRVVTWVDGVRKIEEGKAYASRLEHNFREREMASIHERISNRSISPLEAGQALFDVFRRMGDDPRIRKAREEIASDIATAAMAARALETSHPEIWARASQPELRTRLTWFVRPSFHTGERVLVGEGESAAPFLESGLTPKTDFVLECRAHGP